MNITPPMSSAQRHAFISQFDLADGSRSLIDQLPTFKALSDVPSADPAEGAIVGSNLMAFAEGVSRQNKEDVMDSFLFATLVANKAFNPETQTLEWYARFNRVLATLGWLSASWHYARYRSTHQRFTMDKVGLEILGSAIAAAAMPGPASAAMLAVAADAIKALQAQEKPLNLFERQTKTHSGASFRIGACAESAEGTVNLAMGAVNFLSTSEVTNVLFWEWNSADVQVFRGEDSLILNTRLYARVREDVQQKLGSNAQSAIAEFDI